MLLYLECYKNSLSKGVNILLCQPVLSQWDKEFIADTLTFEQLSQTKYDLFVAVWNTKQTILMLNLHIYTKILCHNTLYCTNTQGIKVLFLAAAAYLSSDITRVIPLLRRKPSCFTLKIMVSRVISDNRYTADAINNTFILILTHFTRAIIKKRCG